jgi:hypothetical protein
MNGKSATLSLTEWTLVVSPKTECDTSIVLWQKNTTQMLHNGLHTDTEILAIPSIYATEVQEHDCQSKAYSKSQATEGEQEDGVSSILPQTVGCWMIRCSWSS